MALYTVTNLQTGNVIPPAPFAQLFRGRETKEISASIADAENDGVKDAINSGLISVVSANDPSFPDAVEGASADGVSLADGAVTTAKIGSESVTVAKMAPQDANDNAPAMSLVLEVAAGGGGSPDDVSVSMSIPSYMIYDVQFLCSDNVGGSTVQLRDAAAGAGNAVSTALDTATTGRKVDDSTDTFVSSASTLYLRRSDDGVGGTLIVQFRNQT